VAFLSDFMVYQSKTSYTVIIAAINSQGSSEPTSKEIGMTLYTVHMVSYICTVTIFVLNMQ